MTLALRRAALQGDLSVREVSVASGVKPGRRCVGRVALDEAATRNAKASTLEGRRAAPPTTIRRHVDAEGSARRSRASLAPVALRRLHRRSTEQRTHRRRRLSERANA